MQVHFEHSGQGADCSIHVKDLKAPCLAQVHTVPPLVNRNTQDIAQGLNLSCFLGFFFFLPEIVKTSLIPTLHNGSFLIAFVREVRR